MGLFIKKWLQLRMKWHKRATSRCCPFIITGWSHVLRKSPPVARSFCQSFDGEAEFTKMHLRMYLEYIIVFHRSKICWNNKNLRTLTVLFRSLWSSDLSRMNNNNKKLKRIHEASKKCTNITKMERHRYILIEISALFFSKTSMLCIFSAFFRRFISV